MSDLRGLNVILGAYGTMTNSDDEGEDETPDDGFPEAIQELFGDDASSDAAQDARAAAEAARSAAYDAAQDGRVGFDVNTISPYLSAFASGFNKPAVAAPDAAALAAQAKAKADADAAERTKMLVIFGAVAVALVGGVIMVARK